MTELILSFLILCCITFLIFYKRQQKKNKWSFKQHHVTFITVCIFLTTLLLELFVFNFRHWQSIGYQETKIPTTLVSSGIAMNSDGSYTLLEDGEYTIEFLNIDKEIKNLYLSYTNKNLSESSKLQDTVSIKLSATDEANALYFDLPARTISAQIPKSQYLSLNLSGVSNKLKLTISEDAGFTFTLNNPKINVNIPLFISWIRIVSVFLIAWGIYILRPKSSIYRYKFNVKSSTQKGVILILILIQANVFQVMITSNPKFTAPQTGQHLQYQRLAKALSNGQVYLADEVPQTLIDMENPYDYYLRAQLMRETGTYYLWDHAYYEGKYYTYFGVVPVILLYLPYYQLTGQDFDTYKGVFLCSILFTVAVYLLLYQIIKRWFPNTPFILYILLSILFINGCGSYYLIRQASFYALPILMGLGFSILGLSLWFSSIKETTTKSSAKKHYTLNKWYLLFGSLCMALVAGCRPQLLLASFLAIPIFWDFVFQKRELFSVKKIGNTLAFCLPYVIIAIGLMYYNYIRFGSVLDFGANYNLTTNDMTKRGFKLDRTGLGLYTYLFQPATVNAIFPFLHGTNFKTNYLGRTIYETIIGGVFCYQVILWPTFFVLQSKLKAVLKTKKLFTFTVLCNIFALIIVIADTQMAGILARYTSDFSWLLFLSASIILLTFAELVKHSTVKEYFYHFLRFAFFTGMLANFLILFMENSSSYFDIVPVTFHKVGYAIQFWL